MRSKNVLYSFNGFSLIEMMVALAILASGIVAVLYGLSGSMEADRRVNQRAIAIDLLKVKVSEYIETDRQVELHSEVFGEPYHEYKWSAEVKTTGIENLYRLEVKVEWKGRSTQKLVSMSTLVPQR